MDRMSQDEATRRWEKNGGVVAGTPTPWIALVNWPDREALCACHPGVGGTMRMEYTVDPLASVEADTAESIVWDAGEVSEATARRLPTNASAVRFVATTADGQYRVVV